MTSSHDPADMRARYTRGALLEADAAADPFEQFARWFEEARASGTIEPNAMTLATVGADGHPAARIVLLKGYGADGFTFFTRYSSDKGQQLDAHPHAALVFWWPPLERQVRIEGRVERVSEEESDAYFQRRPRGSQLGAVASPQSRPIAGRDVLEDNLARLEARLDGDAPVPRPDDWGGYRVLASRIEFWQGRDDRLHDRLLYTRTPGDGWTRTRLAP